MRILLLTASYAPVLGGLQTVTGQLAPGLQTVGHEVRVVTNRYPRTLPENECLDGVSVQRKLFSRPRRDQWRRPHLWVESVLQHPGTLQWLRALLTEWQPDVINVHFPDSQIPYLLRLREQYQGRLVVSLHGDEITRFFGRVSYQKAAGLIELIDTADVITACSSDLLKQVIQLAPAAADKAIVIHNGIDAARFDQAKPYLHPRPYVLGLGRLTYKKGFDLLLAAWAQNDAAMRDLDLIIVGDGEEYESLRRQTAHLKLDEHIRFFGRATPEQVADLLVGCRFVVMPSREEPFGIVAVEALMAGKPLLATHVGGLPEIAATLADLPLIFKLVAPEKQALAIELQRFAVAECPSVTAPVLARHAVEKRFSVKRMILNYEKVMIDNPASAKKTANPLNREIHAT